MEKVELYKEHIYKCATLYHLSDTNLDGKILTPRIPNNRMVRDGREDGKTPRISFSPSITGCLAGVSGDLTGKEFYVHTIDEAFSNPAIKKITNKDVPDQSVTREKWVLNDAKLKRIGKIKVTKTFEKQYKHMKNNTYKWKHVDEKDIDKIASYKELIKIAAITQAKPIVFNKRNFQHIDKIKDASSRTSMVAISYIDKNGNKSTRHVEPYKMDGNDFWGYDPEKGNIRRFKVKNITSVKHTKKTYEPRWDIEMENAGILKSAAFNYHKLDKLRYIRVPRMKINGRLVRIESVVK